MKFHFAILGFKMITYILFQYLRFFQWTLWYFYLFEWSWVIYFTYSRWPYFLKDLSGIVMLYLRTKDGPRTVRRWWWRRPPCPPWWGRNPPWTSQASPHPDLEKKTHNRLLTFHNNYQLPMKNNSGANKSFICQLKTRLARNHSTNNESLSCQ